MGRTYKDELSARRDNLASKRRRLCGWQRKKSKWPKYEYEQFEDVPDYDCKSELVPDWLCK